MPQTNPRRLLSGGRRAAPAKPAKRKRRNASFGGGTMQNIMGTALPALGVGAAGGAAALKIAQATKASPAAVAGVIAALGGIAAAVSKKGGTVNTMAAAAAGLGAGLTTIDIMQKPAAQPQQQQHPAQQQHPQQVAHRQAELVTKDELNAAVRELVELHKETRNAMGAMMAPPPVEHFYEERRDADVIHEEVIHDHRNAAEDWHYAHLDEHRNAAEDWHYAHLDEHRNADMIHEEMVHPHPDGHEHRNAGGGIQEDWHTAHLEHAA